MKLFGRRLMMKSAPVAVAAGGLVAGNITQGDAMGADSNAAINFTYPNMKYSAGAKVLKRAIPSTYSKYIEAQEVLARVDNYRYMRKSVLSNTREGLDLDIQALRSVSKQHKAAMQIARNQREREENRSFLEKLAITLGLTDFLSPTTSDVRATNEISARIPRY